VVTRVLGCLSRVSAPVTPAVSLAVAKMHCRVDHDEEDALIEALIATATDMFDGMDGLLGMAIMPQVWQGKILPTTETIGIPLWPVESVDVIEYVATDGSHLSLPVSAYEIETCSGKASIVPGDDWPDMDPGESITITFTAGSAECPKRVSLAIMMMVAHWYENREAIGTRRFEIPLGVMPLINAYRPQHL